MWDVLTGSCGIGRHVSCSPPSCWGLENGDHPLPGSQCSAYFTCTDGIRTDHICPFNSIFDYMKKVMYYNYHNIEELYKNKI